MCGLISVGWLTLLERLVLGGSQVRIGASKVGLLGILQPLLDGIKLVTKQLILSIGSSKISLLGPGAVTFIISVILLLIVPRNSWYTGSSSFGLLLLLRVSRLPLLISGLVVGSQYAYLGSMRVVVLALSYEVVIFPLLVSFLHITSSVGLVSLFISTGCLVSGVV